MATQIPSKFKDILDKRGFAHVATIGPSGEPENNPVWYEWDGKHVLISQTPDKQKYKNIKREPRVALSIQDPEDPYRRIEIRGHVASIDEDGDRTFINSLAKAYMGKDEYPYDPPGTKRLVVRVDPDHVTTYGG